MSVSKLSCRMGFFNFASRSDSGVKLFIPFENWAAGDEALGSAV